MGPIGDSGDGGLIAFAVIAGIFTLGMAFVMVPIMRKAMKEDQSGRDGQGRG